MAEMTEAYDWSGRSLLDADGEKVGTIDQVYLHLQTEEPLWALVNTGLLGQGSVFVPVGSARPAGGDVLVQVGKAQIEAAPAIQAERELSPEQEAALLRHYRDEPSAPVAEGALTRSEEELQVTKVCRPRTRVRVRKHIVTEMVTTTVPVRREELRVEREPIAEGEAISLDGAEPPEDVHEMILHEERLVIETQVVATERVRILKETITEERALSAEVSTERVVLEEGGETDEG